MSVTLQCNIRVLRTLGCSTSVQSHGCNTRDADTPPMTQVTYNTTSPPMTLVSDNKERSKLKVKEGGNLEIKKEAELNKNI